MQKLCQNDPSGKGEHCFCIDIDAQRGVKKFSMKLFRHWLDEERVENIANTVELVNNKFYRKNGK